ncbi:hypothetical protein J2Z82_000021 [Virgibacillus litoralis]|uniref:Uncharacterized protein n=1 Tax=Virgibacillus litoralis TaxID=578221 RepID=A0ABS4H8B9_9BACI|nr:hypothetical protein [Virgibacillus litoralis]
MAELLCVMPFSCIVKEEDITNAKLDETGAD